MRGFNNFHLSGAVKIERAAQPRRRVFAGTASSKERRRFQVVSQCTLGSRSLEQEVGQARCWPTGRLEPRARVNSDLCGALCSGAACFAYPGARGSRRRAQCGRLASGRVARGGGRQLRAKLREARARLRPGGIACAVRCRLVDVIKRMNLHAHEISLLRQQQSGIAQFGQAGWLAGWRASSLDSPSGASSSLQA